LKQESEIPIGLEFNLYVAHGLLLVVIYVKKPECPVLCTGMNGHVGLGA